MKNTVLKKILLSTAILLSAGFSSITLAHSGGATLGADASATDLASVTCYDDGNGPADHLLIAVEDGSAPIPGLLVNMQAFKDNKMTNVTDPVSGDGNSSPEAMLRGGNGDYRISVNKTNTGLRDFEVTFHCETSNNIHTGTDINVLQVQ
ncbi:MAG: hypothetical protein HOP02_00470 [Methylococcaceae bacterium]|nr:hypothetical protein [Methylococcaceae bacterium]